MSFLEWLSSTEAGFIFYPLFLILLLFILASTIKFIGLKRKRVLLAVSSSLILMAALTGYFLIGYRQSLSEHYSDINTISKRVFGAEPNNSRILIYTMTLMSRNFYFQVKFNEPRPVNKSWVSEWKRCSRASDFSKSNPDPAECNAYYSKQQSLPAKEKNCSVDPNQPFYVGKAKIAFGEDQYAEKNYSEARLIGNKEMTTYCFYWSR